MKIKENKGLSHRVAQMYLDGIRGVSCGGFHSSWTHIPESGAQQQEAILINIDRNPNTLDFWESTILNMSSRKYFDAGHLCFFAACVRTILCYTVVFVSWYQVSLMLFSLNKDKEGEADLPGIRHHHNNPPVGPSSCGEAYSIAKPDIKTDLDLKYHPLNICHWKIWMCFCCHIRVAPLTQHVFWSANSWFCIPKEYFPCEVSIRCMFGGPVDI